VALPDARREQAAVALSVRDILFAGALPGDGNQDYRPEFAVLVRLAGGAAFVPVALRVFQVQVSSHLPGKAGAKDVVDQIGDWFGGQRR
jgi:hypothetical protein